MEDPALKDIAEYLRGARERFEATMDAIPGESGALRPSADSWSVAEIVEHLGIVEARVIGLVTSAAAGLERTETGRGDGKASSVDLGRLLDRSRRVKSTEASRPKGDMSLDAALDLLRKGRDSLLASIAALDGLPLESVTVPHPALGPMNLYQWLRFIGAHEERHTAQIVEVAQAVTASAAARPPAGSDSG